MVPPRVHNGYTFGATKNNFSSNRNSQQNTKRSLTNPDEKSEALKMIKDFCDIQQVPAGPPLTITKESIKDKLDKETIKLKTAPIIDELEQNGNYKVCLWAWFIYQCSTYYRKQ